MCGANGQFRDQLGRNERTWWRRRKSIRAHVTRVSPRQSFRSIWGRSVDMFQFKAVWNWWWLFTCSTKIWPLRWSVGFIQQRETNHVNLKPDICVKTTEFYLLWDSDQSVCFWSYWAEYVNGFQHAGWGCRYLLKSKSVTLSHSWTTSSVSKTPNFT